MRGDTAADAPALASTLEVAAARRAWTSAALHAAARSDPCVPQAEVEQARLLRQEAEFEEEGLRPATCVDVWRSWAMAVLSFSSPRSRVDGESL
jgi:hypothetical protein